MCSRQCNDCETFYCQRNNQFVCTGICAARKACEFYGCMTCKPRKQKNRDGLRELRVRIVENPSGKTPKLSALNGNFIIRIVTQKTIDIESK